MNEKNKDGWMNIHFAVSGGYIDVVEYLFNQGFDIYAKNARNQTPLSLAYNRLKSCEDEYDDDRLESWEFDNYTPESCEEEYDDDNAWNHIIRFLEERNGEE